MKISFVTPAYNRRDLLVETIDSIIVSVSCLPDLDFEMVVVDDASCDDTEKVVFDRYSSWMLREQKIEGSRYLVEIGSFF